MLLSHNSKSTEGTWGPRRKHRTYSSSSSQQKTPSIFSTNWEQFLCCAEVKIRAERETPTWEQPGTETRGGNLSTFSSVTAPSIGSAKGIKALSVSCDFDFLLFVLSQFASQTIVGHHEVHRVGVLLVVRHWVFVLFCFVVGGSTHVLWLKSSGLAVFIFNRTRMN